MKCFEWIEKLSLFNKLVDKSSTGTPKEFAERLSIGRSTLYELIDEYRSRGIYIKYSRRERTFYYENKK